jgi:hypothetical protein
VTPTGLGYARKGRMDCGQSLVCRNPGILVPFPDWPLRPALPPPATNSDPPRAAAATRASIFLRGTSALSPGSRTARLCLANRPSHKDTGRQLRGRPGRRERWRWSGVKCNGPRGDAHIYGATGWPGHWKPSGVGNTTALSWSCEAPHAPNSDSCW